MWTCKEKLPWALASMSHSKSIRHKLAGWKSRGKGRTGEKGGKADIQAQQLPEPSCLAVMLNLLSSRDVEVARSAAVLLQNVLLVDSDDESKKSPQQEQERKEMERRMESGIGARIARSELLLHSMFQVLELPDFLATRDTKRKVVSAVAKLAQSHAAAIRAQKGSSRFISTLQWCGREAGDEHLRADAQAALQRICV